MVSSDSGLECEVSLHRNGSQGLCITKQFLTWLHEVRESVEESTEELHPPFAAIQDMLATECHGSMCSWAGSSGRAAAHGQDMLASCPHKSVAPYTFQLRRKAKRVLSDMRDCLLMLVLWRPRACLEQAISQEICFPELRSTCFGFLSLGSQ